MSAHKIILDGQDKRVRARRWSGKYSDYLADYNDNFIIKPHPDIIEAYKRGAGSEIPTEYDAENNRWYRLYRNKIVPAKMQAIHSSSALVCNAFGYWYDASNKSPLQSALGSTGKIVRIEFEDAKRTGLGGIPPHLDVVIYCEGMVYAIESKFSEPYQEEKNEIVMRSKSYDPALWRNKGLDKCADLVGLINSGKMNGRYKYLSINQLLKHILGLAHNHGQAFELLYLWYEVPSAVESNAHKDEVENFKALLGDEVNFKSITYQDFFQVLKRACDGHHKKYFNGFSARYL